MGRNELLSCVQGILDSAVAWGAVIEAANTTLLAREDDDYARGFARGELVAAQDMVGSINRALSLIETLLKEEDDASE